MFSRLRLTARLIAELWKLAGVAKGAKMDKPITSSWTAWGAVIAGVGGILTLIGTPMSQGMPIDWGAIMPRAIEIVGLVIAAIGARRAVGTLISNGR